jgi:hypothetical protein
VRQYGLSSRLTRYIGSSLVDEDKTVGIEIELSVEPRLAGLVYIAASLLGGVRRLFLSVIFRRLKKRQSEATPVTTPCSINLRRSSTSVMSDFAATCGFRRSRPCIPIGSRPPVPIRSRPGFRFEAGHPLLASTGLGR